MLTATDAEGTTILVCDDEKMVVDFLAPAIRASGFTVVTAEGGDEALRKVHAEGKPVDLLITDVAMGDMSGPELARRMMQAHPGLRVLFMTGCGPEVLTSENGLGDGAELILKPFKGEELLAKIRELLARGPAARAG